MSFYNKYWGVRLEDDGVDHYFTYTGEPITSMKIICTGESFTNKYHRSHTSPTWCGSNEDNHYFQNRLLQPYEMSVDKIMQGDIIEWNPCSDCENVILMWELAE